MTKPHPVEVPTPAATSTVTTTIIKRRPIAVLLLNVANGAVSAALAILAYLQTVNLAGIVTPEKALLWMVGINVLTIVLRQFASPQVIETRIDPAPGGQP